MIKAATGFKYLKPFPQIIGHGMECGTTSLAMIFKYYGLPNLQVELAEAASVSTDGTNLRMLSELASQFGFETASYHIHYDQFDQVQLPCIAHIKGNHFVVVYRVGKNRLRICDPVDSRIKMTRSEFEKDWGGVVLCLKPPTHFDNERVTEAIAKTKARQEKAKTIYKQWLGENRKQLWRILLVAFISQPLLLFFPLLAQWLLDHVIVNQAEPLTYWPIGLGFLILLTIVTFFRRTAVAGLSRSLGRQMTDAFFHKLTYMPQSFYDNHKNEDLLLRVQDNERVKQFFVEVPYRTLANSLLVLCCLLVFVFYHRQLALIVTCLLLFYIGCYLYFDTQLRAITTKIHMDQNKIVVRFLDVLYGLQTVKLLGAEDKIFRAWSQSHREKTESTFRKEQLQALIYSCSIAANTAVQLFIYAVVTYFAIAQQLSIGQIVAVILIYGLASQALERLLIIWQSFDAYLPSLSNVHDVFLQESEFHQGQSQTEAPQNSDIKLEALTFRYSSDQEFPVLDNLNFQIKAGEKIGIVGRNGSGKSTFLKLLVRLYESDQGQITLGGQDLKTIKAASLRHKIFMFPQDVYVFDDTIAKNIAYGNETATEEEIIKAAELSGLNRFIEKTFYGYEHRIGSLGSQNLSGGEKLKLGFARLFLSKPDIIILDEASSALDIEAEQEIFINLKQAFADKTIISVTHRLNTLRTVDRILVFDEGALVEDGKHEELLANQGMYQRYISTYLNF